MTLAPDVRSWLASVGVAEPEHVRRIASARSADLIVLDDLVLRWYGATSHLDDEPDAIAREVAILEALAATTVPAPRLVAWSDDPPAVLATLVPGEPRMDLPDAGPLGGVSTPSIRSIPVHSPDGDTAGITRTPNSSDPLGGWTRLCGTGPSSRRQMLARALRPS